MARKAKAPATLEDISPAIERLAQLYTFRDEAEVTHFITENPFLIDLLLEAAEKIKLEFPNNQLTLKVFSDAETVGDTRLVIVIATNYRPQETLTRLDRLEDQWLLDAVDAAQDKLSVNVEYC